MSDLDLLKALLAAAMQAAGASDPDIQACGAQCAQLCGDLAAAKGLDLSSPVAAADKADPAALAPGGATASRPKVDPAASGPATSTVSAGAGVTRGEVQSIVENALASVGAATRSAVAEEAERSAIIRENGDVLGTLAAFASKQPLPVVKTLIQGLRANAAKAPSSAGGEDVRGEKIDPSKAPGGALDARSKDVVGAVAKRMGLKAEDVEKQALALRRGDEDATVSVLELYRNRDADRRKSAARK